MLIVGEVRKGKRLDTLMGYKKGILLSTNLGLPNERKLKIRVSVGWGGQNSKKKVINEEKRLHI